MNNALNDVTQSAFARDGSLVVRGLADDSILAPMRESVLRALQPLQAPVEFEAEVGYPGAPVDRNATGGDTARRLLHAYSRDAVFRRWATAPEVALIRRSLMHEVAV